MDYFIEYLTNTKDHIRWADDAVNIFIEIKKINETAPDLNKELKLKLKHLQNYIQIDLLCHITSPVARQPFYFSNLKKILEKLNELSVQNGKTENGGVKNGTGGHEDLAEHGSICDGIAELNLILTEFGFISGSDDEIQNSDNPGKQLSTLKQSLLDIEKKLKEDKDEYDLAYELREVSRHWGKLVDNSFISGSSISPELEDLEVEIDRIHIDLIQKCLDVKKPPTLGYLALYHLLKKDFVGKLYQSDAQNMLSSHVVHPATRGWLLERIRRWIKKPRTPEKRLYYVMGKQGYGRTSLAAAVCKLHSCDVVASHFFGDTNITNAKLHNSLVGLLQSISVSLMQTLPDYLNHLDDKLSGLTNLEQVLTTSWKDVYQLLIKEPLQSLYGKIKSDQANGKTHRRKIIVIDASEECAMTEWKDLYAFITQFLKDTSFIFCAFVTVRSKKSAAILPTIDQEWEGIRLDDKAWVGPHIADLEKYMAHSVGTILSRGAPVVEEKDKGAKPGVRPGINRVDRTQPAMTGTSPTSANHGLVDQRTLEQTVDEFVKMTAGRFDWAVDLVELFSKEMDASGHQFIGSVKRVTGQMRDGHGGGQAPPLSPGAAQKKGLTPEKTFVERTTEFCGSFRAHRDKSGRSEGVKVTSPRQHAQNISRLPLLVSRLEI